MRGYVGGRARFAIKQKKIQKKKEKKKRERVTQDEGRKHVQRKEPKGAPTAKGRPRGILGPHITHAE